MKNICDYGCGQEAKFQFKNGKWCCSYNFRSCFAYRMKMRENQRGEKNSFYRKHHSEETKKKQRENMPNNSGENHSMFGKHFSKESTEKRAENLRTPFEKIIEFVENNGYELLSKSEDYKNQFSYLWFRCPKGHVFKKRWDSFLAGHRCNKCTNEEKKQEMLNGKATYVRSFIKNPSKPQVELFNLIKEEYPESKIEYSCLNYSIDIVIPNLKIAIEYDGSYWHQDQESDDKRQKEIEQEGWTFLRYVDYVPSKEELRRDIFLKIQEVA